MTLDDALKVAKIVGMADNACSTCVRYLVDELNEQFRAFEFKLTDEIVTDFRPDDTDYPTGPRWCLITVNPTTQDVRD